MRTIDFFRFEKIYRIRLKAPSRGFGGRSPININQEKIKNNQTYIIDNIK